MAHTRPRNRRQLIIQAAARLFCERGYHNVGLSDIAAAVGISAPALYRHFRNKEDLLLHAVLDSFDEFEEAVVAAPALDASLRALASVAVRRRDFGLLWQRETRNLPPALRDEALRRFRRTVARLASLVRRSRAELSAADDDLLAWSVCAVLASPSHRSTRTDPVSLEPVINNMARAVTAAPIDAASGRTGVWRPKGDRPASGVRLASRREALVTAATGLFGQRGFHEISVDEIGQAVGIAGPSVYKHFATKSDLLYAALDRGAQSLQLLLTGTLDGATSPAEALDALLGSYVEFTLTHTSLVTALVTEVIHLPPEQQSTLRRLQHDYVTEWEHLLRAARPGLDAATAALLTRAALGVVNDVAPIRHLRGRDRFDADLASIGRAVLYTPI
ncbi:TetR family transcriptional regulator [Nonomuraea sp. NPDC000554]|uniref:TetR/AcrR family transcriptional regulator n=1 Tax=Nonomuraea sp. NPDC000554 TaxID=3154259 RepID=UPI003326E244